MLPMLLACLGILHEVHDDDDAVYSWASHQNLVLTSTAAAYSPSIPKALKT